MKKERKYGLLSLGCLIAFVLWTIAVYTLDRQPIGPCDTVVGFAGMNGWAHHLTGVCMPIYTITDWLGLAPVAIGLGFAILGLCQWVKRKHILKVESNLLILGVFYLVMLGVYLLFEMLVINYRPVLIAGYLEVSYPSSTTLLTLCVMPTTLWQIRCRMKPSFFRRCLMAAIWLFMLFMVGGRLLAGVHWFTDIIGGGLLSAGLVLLYDVTCRLAEK